MKHYDKIRKVVVSLKIISFNAAKKQFLRVVSLYKLQNVSEVGIGMEE